MTNKEIAKEFQFLGKIMELHGENPFKTKSYANAYLNLRKWPHALAAMSESELAEIPGVGKAIKEKIAELLSTGEIQTLNRYKEMTPVGIQDLLRIKGLGPKKIKLVWEELGVESPGELLYASEENRLVELKGFGAKTQAQLIQQLKYHFASKGKMHFSVAEALSNELLNLLENIYDEPFALTGSIYRKEPIIEQIEILTTLSIDENAPSQQIEDLLQDDDGSFYFRDCPVLFLESTYENWGTELVATSSSQDFLDAMGFLEAAEEEEQVFDQVNLSFVPAEMRDDPYILNYPDLVDGTIRMEDIKGVVHNHSTYSDGLNTVAEMAAACIEKGYEYLVMSDHSKSAFYANGLQVDRVYHQWEEIDLLNEGYDNFKIFKSIESDILSDGSLDYDDEILEGFDLVIASVHSNLKMDIDKATNRLIKAIENPHTRILGHPTGRLLLSREGYPIDHKKVLDACAANGVEVELNANPYRLDLDWTWIPYATEKGVMISINPDAHSISGIDDIYYGVCVARKAFLQVDSCLNAKSVDIFQKWVER